MISSIMLHRVAVFALAIFVATLLLAQRSTTATEGSGQQEGSGQRGEKHSRPTSFQQVEIETLQRRMREGTIITDSTGVFRQDGDGALFVTDDGWEFGSLANLNLERVVRVLKSSDEPVEMRWSVSGTITEFSGRNFLLISRATYRSSAAASAVENLKPQKNP